MFCLTWQRFKMYKFISLNQVSQNSVAQECSKDGCLVFLAQLLCLLLQFICCHSYMSYRIYKSGFLPEETQPFPESQSRWYQ